MRFEPRNRAIALAAAAFLAGSAAAGAHPHVFAEARLDVTVAADGTVQSLRHLWRFDDLFSSTVLLEFDTDRDLALSPAELEVVGEVVHESLAEFDYFQMVKADGRDVAMRPPERMIALFDDNQLTILFESEPVEPLRLDGRVDFGVYDPTFYTAIDFYEDENMAVAGLPEGCASAVVRPDPDEAIAANQATLTEAFFNDPTGNDLSSIFATRLELTCPGSG